MKEKKEKKFVIETTDEFEVVEEAIDTPEEVEVVEEPAVVELSSRNEGLFDAPAVALMSKWLIGSDDFKISGQVKSMLKFVPSVIAIEWGLGGCALIEALQSKIGARSTGYIDMETVKALQKFLNNEGFKIEVDGIWGDATSEAFIQFLSNIK